MSSPKQGSAVEVGVMVAAFLAVAVSLIVWLFGEDVPGRVFGPHIIGTVEKIDLAAVGGEDGHISLINVRNKGLRASRGIRLLFRFTSDDLVIDVSSDEDIASTSVQRGVVELTLPRLSPGAVVRLAVRSRGSSSLTEGIYVDDYTRSPVVFSSLDGPDIGVGRVLFVTMVFLSLYAFYRVQMRVMERRMKSRLDQLVEFFGEQLRDIKAEIVNLDISDATLGSAQAARKNDSVSGSEVAGGAEDRLQQFLEKFK